ETAPFNRSGTSPGWCLQDLRGFPQVVSASCYRICYRISRYPVDSLRLGTHVLIREPSVTLGRNDRGVPEGALQRRQISPALQPTTRKRVAHLVSMEMLDT